MVCGFRVYQKEYQNMFVFPPAWFILFLLLFIFYFYILPPVQNCSSCYGPQTCKVRLNIYQVTDCPTLIVNCIWERHFALVFFFIFFFSTQTCECYFIASDFMFWSEYTHELDMERKSDACIHHKTLHFLLQNAAWLMLCSSFELWLMGMQLWGR